MSESQANHPTDVSEKKRQGPRSNNHRPRRRPQTNQAKTSPERQAHSASIATVTQHDRATANATQKERPQNTHRRHRRPRRTNQQAQTDRTVVKQSQQTTNEKSHESHNEQTNAHNSGRQRSDKRSTDRNHSQLDKARLTKDTPTKRPEARKRSEPVHQAEGTMSATPVASVHAAEPTPIRANLADAFVDHETKPLEPQPRQALHVFVRNLRQVRQLRRFGDIDYISKKLHYVVIYMNKEDIAKNQQAINKLSFVRRVMLSARPEIDPFVGQGVNANFVTHTENDGAANALSESNALSETQSAAPETPAPTTEEH